MEFTSDYNYMGHKFSLEITYGNVAVRVDSVFQGNYPDTKSAFVGAKKAIEMIVSGKLPTHKPYRYDESDE
jgi:hypothetical protein